MQVATTKFAPVVPGGSVPVKAPFDPISTAPVPFGRVPSALGTPAMQVVFAPPAGGFQRFEAWRDAVDAVRLLVPDATRETAIAVQYGSDGAFWLGEVREAGTLAPVHLATAGRSFQSNGDGAGAVFDHAYLVSFGNYARG